MPVVGRVHTIYILFMTIHKAYVAFMLPFRIAFEDEPSWANIGIETYMDLVFFIDIFITFITPITDKNGRLITAKKPIAKKYLGFWFAFDVLCLFPLFYLRKISENNERSQNDIENFFTFNFKYLPRFYLVLLAVKFVRTRNLGNYFVSLLKKINLR